MSNKNLSNFIKRLVPISDFSKEKTAQIFNDLRDQIKNLNLK
jgi:hypothetical protein